MAKTIVQDAPKRQWPELLRASLVGLGTGLAHWLLGVVLNRYVVEPSACREITDGLQCAQAPMLSSDIAGVLVAGAALVVFILLRQTRPIVIVAASLALLWGVKGFVYGLPWWGELLAFVLLYGLTYVTFGWINKATRLLGAIVLAVLLVLIARLVLLVG